MTSGSGKCTKYSCGDKECTWGVRVSRRVDGAMYVSTINEKHYEFGASMSKPTQRWIRSLRTFQAASCGDRNMKLKTLASLTQGRANLEANGSKLYRAKNEVVDILMEDGVNIS
uniref:FLYWCH-type domain-containing protein n=1 Tax=Peronospora matthiolae TaxID=2874970 RepID=A0AAV1U8U4_9STRA